MIKQKNKDLKYMLTGIGVVILYLVLSELSIPLLVSFGINYYNLSLSLKLTYLILYQAIMTLIIIYIYRKDFIPNFKIFVKNIKNYLDKYLKYWILAVILMLISNIIITNFTVAKVANNQSGILESLEKYPIYTIFISVVIAPVLEELVFRLSIQKMFQHTASLFILFSGLFFGSMHVFGSATNITDFLFIIPYSMPGFVFAYTYYKSKNICVPISLHLIHNSTMVIIQIIIFILT